ncbi:MAG: aquaporin [Alphaproteobacteria bacterium GM202ARS2]|nr:aquaporin [Alphaproteobacteria bacterium GM202ARS2]
MYMPQPLSARFAAEFFGTALLLVAIVGSVIVADGLRTQPLLINALATGGALFVGITLAQPFSGGHFNPAVTLAFIFSGDTDWHDGVVYILAQVLGAVVAVAAVHTMFDTPALQTPPPTSIATGGLWLSEILMTFGLVMVALIAAAQHPERLPLLVSTYVTLAVLVSSSGAYINPAATFARTFTTSNVGIATENAVPFIVFQLLGSILATVLVIKILCPLAVVTKKAQTNKKD